MSSSRASAAASLTSIAAASAAALEASKAAAFFLPPVTASAAAKMTSIAAFLTSPPFALQNMGPARTQEVGVMANSRPTRPNHRSIKIAIKGVSGRSRTDLDTFPQVSSRSGAGGILVRGASGPALVWQQWRRCGRQLAANRRQGIWPVRQLHPCRRNRSWTATRRPPQRSPIPPASPRAQLFRRKVQIGRRKGRRTGRDGR